MNAEEHRALRDMLGALALGQLPPAEESTVRTHVEGCAHCRAELTELQPVVRQLELLSPVALRTPARPPVDLGNRVTRAVAAARAGERRRWYARIGLVATAAAVAAAVVSALVVRGLQPDAPPLEPVAVTVSTAGVTASADLVAHTWGTEIKLTGAGFEAGATYRVVIVTDDGMERPAGEFVGTGAAPMLCNLNSAVLRPEAAGFVVVDDTGREVLASDFPG